MRQIWPGFGWTITRRHRLTGTSTSIIETGIPTIGLVHPTAAGPAGGFHRPKRSRRMPGDDHQNALRMLPRRRNRRATALLQPWNAGRMHRWVCHQRLCGAGRHMSALHRHRFPGTLTTAHLDHPVSGPSHVDRRHRDRRAAEHLAPRACLVTGGTVGRCYGLLGDAAHGPVQATTVRAADIGSIAFADRRIVVGHAVLLPSTPVVIGATLVSGVGEAEILGEMLGPKIAVEVFDHVTIPAGFGLAARCRGRP